MKISEIFCSIQGEGQQAGEITTFIRTVGCNMRCKWCDTQYAYEGGREMSIIEILTNVKKLGAKNICLTGGEPLLQEDITDLISRLIQSGYKVFIETNGSQNTRIIEKGLEKDIPISGLEDRLYWVLDYKLPSSGMWGKFDYENLKANCIYEIKFVIANQEEYELAKETIKAMSVYFEDCEEMYKPKYLISPCFNPEWNTVLAELMIKDNLNAKYSLQIHKVLWDINKRGV